MRTLRRNRQTLWYANPTGTEYVVDANGFKTGAPKTTYGTPKKVEFSMTFSAQVGHDGHAPSAVLDKQGIVTGYSWMALTDDMDCPVNEESILWYKKAPTRTVTVTTTVNGQTVTENRTELTPYNMMVVRKIPSLNNVQYFLKEADVG